MKYFTQVQPDQKKKRLKFEKDPNHILDKNLKFSKLSLSMFSSMVLAFKYI